MKLGFTIQRNYCRVIPDNLWISVPTQEQRILLYNNDRAKKILKQAKEWGLENEKN